jgi:hypothetical protein
MNFQFIGCGFTLFLISSRITGSRIVPALSQQSLELIGRRALQRYRPPLLFSRR